MKKITRPITNQLLKAKKYGKNPNCERTIKMKKIIFVFLLILILISLFTMSSCNHEHNWSDWQSSKSATCTQDGIDMRFCDDCGESQSMPISATGHVWSDWNTIQAATCTQDGLKERTCVCGEEETKTISAFGHTFGAWNTTQEATCTVDGTKERTCSCGEKETDTIVASHAWKDATCTEAKNCSKCGLTDGAALGHTCSIGECSRCKSEVYPNVNLPSTPLTVWYFSSSSMKITELSYEFDADGNLIISFSGEKTSGSDSGPVAFSFKVLDEDGYTLHTDFWKKYGYCTGDKLKNQTVKVSSAHLSSSSEYTIVITDCNH